MSESENKGLDDEELLWGKLLSDVVSSPIRQGSFNLTQSSTISQASYDPSKEVFSVHFRSNPSVRYVFYKVPEAIASSFFECAKEQKSIGRFFQTKIKGHFTFLREVIKEQKSI